MQKIIATDFDGTLCEFCWPEIGRANRAVINALLDEQAHGAKIILWTCRTGKQLEEAVEWCSREGIAFDAVNENLPENTELYGSDCRKVHASEYWDDRSVIVHHGRLSKLTAVVKESHSFPGIQTIWLDESLRLRTWQTELVKPRRLKRWWAMWLNMISARKKKTV